MEILAPAGSMEALKAAVQNGADSVYLGLGAFNARRNAKNFTYEEFADAVRYCHIRGAKVYVTLNTLVSDRELPKMADLVAAAESVGADALLVQDIGAVSMIRQVAPNIPLHASTQMTVHNLDGARAAADMGFSRVVLARELTKQQIAYICRNSPIESEVFVHGALCVCWSGQCYMSAVIGRRSGNRGLCAQPCRLPYGFGKAEESWPLSMKDNCLAEHLRELQEIGVSCLKIEGRMKRPEYVAVATRVFSDAVRSGIPPDSRDIAMLRAAFSRQGFTDGYYEGEKGPEMFGIREDERENKKLFSAARATYQSGELQRVPVRYYCILRAGDPMMLAVQDDAGNICKAEGELPQNALSREVTEEVLEQQLKKSGGTPYYCTGVKAIVEPGLSVPLSAVNAMRREVLSRLTALRGRTGERDVGTYRPGSRLPNRSEPPCMTVSVMKAEQVTPELIACSPAVLYMPLSEMLEHPETVEAVLDNKNITPAVSLPRIIGDNEMAAVKKKLDRVHLMGVREALIGNIGFIEPARSRGFALRGDFGLNVFNSPALLHLRKEGFLSAAASFELSLAQVRDLSKTLDVELIAYGRLPLMVTENCIIRNRAGVCACDNTVELTDRTGTRFPLVRDPGGCRNILLNSQKLYLADKHREYSACGLWAIRLMFTTENPAEVTGVVQRYQQQSPFEPMGFTRGLYYRGVE